MEVSGRADRKGHVGGFGPGHVGPTLGAAFLYALALRRLPASIAGTVATLEPVMGIALAMRVRGEPVAIPQLLGAGLIIVGVIVLSLRGEA